MDEHDLKNPIKQFPPYQFAERICRAWQDNNKIAIVKSRQVMMSWLMVALHFWLAFFHRAALCFFVSKKEEDADTLLDRARVIYDNLPEPWKRANPISQKYCEISFPKFKSRIRALPSGTDQIRMHTSSAIFLDEAAFQDNQRENFTAAFPSVRRGGKITAVSTPNGPNYFAEIILDSSTEGGDMDRFLKDNWVGLKSYAARLNPKNGFYVIDVGLDELIKGECKLRKLRGQNAVKFHQQFTAQAYEGLDEQGIQQEYGRNFFVTKGKKLYPGYKDSQCARNLIYNPDRPLLCGWDFGYHWPAVVFTQHDPTNRCFFVLGEYMKHDMEIFDFIPQVKEFIQQRWPCVREIKHFCDPAGAAVNDKSMKSSIDVCADQGIFQSYVRSSINEGIDIIRDLIRDKKFYIDNECWILRNGFMSGLVYQETKEGKPESELPKKDGFYEHCHDSLRYIVVNNLNLFKTPAPQKEKKPFIMPLLHQGIKPNRMREHWFYGN